MELRRVLLLDDPATRTFEVGLREVVPHATVHAVSALGELLAELQGGSYDLVGIWAARTDALAAARAADAELPVAAVADRGDVDSAAEAVHAGASDFLVLGPKLRERVQILVRKLSSVVRMRRENRRLRQAESPWALLGDSAPMRELRAAILRVAKVPRPVLVVGERGSGKELVARAIHEASGLGPLVVVNCAAFTDTLLETELFGHEKGAFTGADQRVPGKFEVADRGTLFLDEVACMSVAFQQKVLRVVEYGALHRVGGVDEIRTSARVVAATNADLSQHIAAGTFLPDLYDRLAFAVLRVPPLRERREDVPLLAAHFLERFGKEMPELAGRTLSEGALHALRDHAFPGNVRELKHLVERAAIRGTDGPVEAADLELHVEPAPVGTLDERVDAYRRRQIRDALARCGGNQAAAARSLGLTYDQIRHWVKRYGL
ncbi:MAG: sigma-54-dependent Fis family transcriptional regulator [Alphaproteobacteria bacterium]|nr:sigma-54-dependent Fis family transcriptional regulator [Alphaproteobacteria bacterium]